MQPEIERGCTPCGGEDVTVIHEQHVRFEPVVPQMDWPPDGVPTARLLSAEKDTKVRLVATLARAAMDFLSGSQRAQLRACSAPPCVRYFVKSHERQEWCKPSCGNRVRPAHHYRRQRMAAYGGSTPS